MAAKKKPKVRVKGGLSIKATVARLEELQEAEDWSAFEKTVVDAIRQAHDSKTIRALADASGVEEMLLGEGDPGPLIAAALLDKAFELGGADGAKVIGIAVRAAIHDTFEVTRRAVQGDALKSVTAKPEFLATLDRAVERFRKGSKASAGPFRAAAVYALGVVRTSGVGDLKMILDGLLAERVAEARTAMLLTTAVLLRREGVSTPLAEQVLRRVQELEQKLGAKITSLETAALVLVFAVLKQSPSDDLVTAMRAALKNPAPLPASFGFLSGATTMSLFELAFSSLPITSVEPVLEMLTKSPVFAELLFELGFGAKPQSELALGLLLSELSPRERLVLQAFAGKAFEREHVFGRKLGFFSNQSIGKFLSESGTWWSPIPVETKEGPKNLHPLQIWRRTARDSISVEAALAAFTKALPPEALSELACSDEEAVGTQEALRDVEDRKRERRLSVGLLEWLEAHDEQWPERAAAWPKNYGRSPHTGLALLRLFSSGRLPLREDFFSPIQYSVLHILTHPPEGIVEFARKLPVEWKERIAEQSRSYADAVRELLA